jgi:hypothetical protein
VILAIHIWNNTLHGLYPLSPIKNEIVTLRFGDMTIPRFQAKDKVKIFFLRRTPQQMLRAHRSLNAYCANLS